MPRTLTERNKERILRDAIVSAARCKMKLEAIEAAEAEIEARGSLPRETRLEINRKLAKRIDDGQNHYVQISAKWAPASDRRPAIWSGRYGEIGTMHRAGALESRVALVGYDAIELAIAAGYLPESSAAA